MKELMIKKQILENAGDIQYWLNIVNSDQLLDWEINNKELTIYWGEDGVTQFFVTLDKKVSSFILKGRALKGPLKTSMARYLAWQRINKLERKKI